MKTLILHDYYLTWYGSVQTIVQQSTRPGPAKKARPVKEGSHNLHYDTINFV